MHWWKQHQPLLWYIMIHRPRPSLSIKNRSNLRLVRQRGPKARALLQMIAGPGKFQRIGIEKNQAAGIHQRCRHGILMFFANYERWWPRPSEMFFFFNTRLLYMMTSIHPYMRTYRYIYIYIHLTAILIKWTAWTNLAVLNCTGLSAKQNLCFILMFLVKSLRNPMDPVVPS